MKKNNDEIIFNLQDDASSAQISGIDQESIKKLQKELRKELGLDNDESQLIVEVPIINAKKDKDSYKVEDKKAADKTVKADKAVIDNDKPEKSAKISATIENKEAKEEITKPKEKAAEAKVEPEVKSKANEDKKASTLEKEKNEKQSKISEPKIAENSVKTEPISEPIKEQPAKSIKIIKEADLEDAEKADNRKMTNDEKPEELTDHYEEFFKQYSKKDSDEMSNFGKYDSSLDFKLNRKIKKVRLPMPKKTKILLASLALCFVFAISITLGVTLYKKPENVILKNVYLSQTKVEGVYVNDEVEFNNIYLNCEYSDGNIVKVPLTKDMVINMGGVIKQNVFTQKGNGVVEISYLGKNLILTFNVIEKNVSSIDVISTTIEGNNHKITDLSKKLVVIQNYNTGESFMVSLDKCTFMCNGNTLTYNANTDELILSSYVSEGNSTLTINYLGFSKNVSFYLSNI